MWYHDYLKCVPGSEMDLICDERQDPRSDYAKGKRWDLEWACLEPNFEEKAYLMPYRYKPLSPCLLAHL